MNTQKEKNDKRTLQLVIATSITIAGVAMICAGFCVPPLGVIDASVLTAFGEILTFAGALFGMDYHYKSNL